jgi:phosphohistidine phosphatase SixA
MKIASRLNTFALALVFTSLLTGCAIDQGSDLSYHADTGVATTVILTRHGDRDSASNVLNEKGRARALALVGEIGDMNITAIYCPNLVRNIDTARPLANHLGVKIETFDDMSKVHDVIASIMDQHRGETILWVGNTSNLPQFYFKLGGEGAPPTKYGDLFIIKLKGKASPEIVRNRYGPGS